MKVENSYVIVKLLALEIIYWLAIAKMRRDEDQLCKLWLEETEMTREVH